MPFQKLEYLFNKYMSNNCSIMEKEQLAQMVLLPENKNYIIKLLENEWNNSTEREKMSEEKVEQILQSIFNENPTPLKQLPNPFAIIPVHKKVNWHKFAVAASVLIIAGISVYIFLQKISNSSQQNKPVVSSSDIKAPRLSKAVIILSNGAQLALDSIKQGTLALQDSVHIIKNVNGEIVYKGSSTQITYNTLYNPRGSKIVNITLQDGTKVWLNNESSLKYPTAFYGNERKVEVSGEAYFEVAPSTAKKFLVITEGVTTEVWGTHFNVNAYSSTTSVKVTLLQGSIKVINNNSSKFIAPGQQAQLNSTEEININKNVDTDEVTAWKDGLFNFNSLSIQEIMREIEKWYDINVAYEGRQTNKHFSGIFSREDDISEILKMMEMAGIKFRIEGKKVTVIE